MLRFTSESFRDVTFLEADGEAMLAAMGCSGRIPGALPPDDLPVALASLREAVRAAHAREQHVADEEDDDQIVAARSRAQPLVELLEAAIAGESYVSWDHS